MSEGNPDVIIFDRAKKFDFLAVLAAYVRLIDALAARYSGAGVILPKRSGAWQRFIWNEAGQRKVSSFWLSAKAVMDASDERVCHPAGPVTAQAQLFGSWAYRPSVPDDVVVPELMECEPVVRVYGCEIGDGDAPIFSMPSRQEIMQVERLVGLDLAELNLKFDMSPEVVQPASGAKESHGVITFPHSAYGDGYGPVRVRVRDGSGGRTRKGPIVLN